MGRLNNGSKQTKNATNRETADMNISGSDSDTTPVTEQSSSEKSSIQAKAVFKEGKIESNPKSEQRLKQILAKKLENRKITKTNNKTLKEQLDAKYPNPSSPKPDLDDSFGPNLPPKIENS